MANGFYVWSDVTEFVFTASNTFSSSADLCVPEGSCGPQSSAYSVTFDVSETGLPLQVALTDSSDPLVWHDLPATINTFENAYFDFSLRVKPGETWLGTGPYTYSISSSGFTEYTSGEFSLDVEPDTEPPVISLYGDNPMTLSCGAAYSEPGAQVTDNADPSPALDITGTVDHTTPGQYTITYTATDASSNSSIETRTVIVETDTTPPVLELIGLNPMSVLQNSTFNDPGAEATDNCDEPTTVYGTGTVDTSTLGSYTLTYNHQDSSGNSAAQITRTVNVVTVATPPTVSFVGPDTIQVPVSQFNTGSFDSSCLNPGVSFSDEFTSFSYTPGQAYTGSNGSCGVWFNPPNQSPCGNLCTYFLGGSTGTYYITYGAKNGLGLETRRTRTIEVVQDTTGPVVSLNGPSVVQVPYRGTYTEQGATAIDNNCQTWGTNSLNISYSGGFSPWGTQSTPGLYTATYSATDISGNLGQASRTIVVQDDTVSPVVTVTGNSTITLKHGQSWQDPGFEATDDKHEPWELSKETLGTVNTNVIGTYVLTYRATDPRGNVGTAQRTVNVVAKQPPQMNFTGGLTYTVQQNSSWSNPSPEVTDPDGVFEYGDITVTVQGQINLQLIGTYTLLYKAQDPFGYFSTQSISVTVTDGTPPTISLFGSNPQSIYANPEANYQDPGAYVYDNYDSGRIIYGTGFVDMATIGTYTRTYSTSDAAGNAANPVQRTINILEPPDVIPPSIVLLGNNPDTHPVDAEEWEDMGYIVADNKDENVVVTVTGSVGSSIGSYTITYVAEDDAGNKTTVLRTVLVVDTIPPVLSLIGAAQVTIQRKGSYVDQGANVEDNYDPARTIYGTGTINNLVPGSYLLNYSAQDSSGNQATSITREVIVAPDTQPPVLQLNGQSIVSLVQGEPYIELGATATDAIDGALTVSILVEKIG